MTNIFRYLTALSVITTSSILGVAATIATVEARHQTFIRSLTDASTAVPSPFDTPLGIRSVFTLAAGFISSCPAGSNLAIVPFTALTLTGSSAVVAGDVLQLSTTATGATFCAFVNGGQTGGTAFTAFANGACTVPQGLAGIAYLSLSTAGPATGVLTDDITVAGPVVVSVS